MYISCDFVLYSGPTFYTWRFVECVPPFTHGVLYRAARFTMPTVMRKPCGVKPTPPAEAA